MQHSNKREIVNRSVKILIFIAGFILLNCVCNFVFVARDTEKQSRQMWQGYSECEDIDLMFMGTSVGNMVRTEVVDEIVGSNSYNMCTPNQFFGTTIDAVKLVANQHPVKKIIILSGFSSLEEAEDYRAFSAFHNSLYASCSPAVKNEHIMQEMLKRSVSKENVNKPFSMNLWYKWVVGGQKSLGAVKDILIDKVQSLKSGYADEQVAYVINPDEKKYNRIEPAEYAYETDDSKNSWSTCDVSDEALEDLDYIIKYCNANDIEVTVIHTLHRSDYAMKYENEYPEIDTFFRKFVEERGAKYYNMDNEANIRSLFSDDMFVDDEHMGEEGKDEISTIMATLIKEGKL